jgi:hypothetical protein
MVERFGFKVTKYERNFANKEKKVDVAIAHRMTKDAYSGVVRPGSDEMTLVAGDSDYVPVVIDLVSAGFIVHVAFWGHAAKELRGGRPIRAIGRSLRLSLASQNVDCLGRSRGLRMGPTGPDSWIHLDPRKRRQT